MRINLPRPWAIQPGFFDIYAGMSISDIKALRAESPGMVTKRKGKIAILNLKGVLVYDTDFWGELFGDISVISFRNKLRALTADPEISTIMLNIDSPGGQVFGMEEAAAEIRTARETKRVVAFANPLAASGAYYLGSQASEFYMTPSGQVGSIGVYITHIDVSQQLSDDGVVFNVISAGKYKTERNSSQPLSDDARADLQNMVDTYYNQFVKDVAKGRGVSTKDVLANFGQGRMLMSAAAKKAGMVDGIKTFPEVLKRLGADPGSAPIASSTTPAPQANTTSIPISSIGTNVLRARVEIETARTHLNATTRKDHKNV